MQDPNSWTWESAFLRAAPWGPVLQGFVSSGINVSWPLTRKLLGLELQLWFTMLRVASQAACGVEALVTPSWRVGMSLGAASS